jgi:hypothetical protein
MRKSLKIELALIAALVAPLAGHAKVVKAMGQVPETRRPLDCYIDNNYRLKVGSTYAIRKGTPISFTATLADYPYSPYDRTIPLPQDIPAHLFVTLTNQYDPKLSGHCSAWWTQPWVNQ